MEIYSIWDIAFGLTLC